MTDSQSSAGQEVVGKYVRPPLCVKRDDAALIVIDMQNDFLHPEGAYGRHGVHNSKAGAVIQTVPGVIERCRKLRIPVIYARYVIRAGPDGRAVDAGSITNARPFLWDEGLRAGTWGAAFVDGFPAPDYDIEKPRFSAFYQTNLEVLLRGLGVRTLLFAGVQTNYCVESTARDAYFRDFQIVMLSDCMTCFDRRLHEASLETLANMGSVATSSEVLAALESGTQRGDE
jgi:ureidoacrylate peracid hydrolase